MKNLFKALGYVVAALLFVVVASWLSGKIKPENNPPVVLPVKPAVSCPIDFLSFTTIGQKVNLIDKRMAMFANNGQFINPQIVVAKSETDNSKVACGYLFVRAGTQTNGALQSWEDVYINPNMFGGHIISQNAIVINDGSEYSEYLFSLDKIPYWPTVARKPAQIANWAYLLNVSNEVKFNIALNTNDKSGFIDEMTIAYKCWNPLTGEENNECKLYIASSKETKTDTLLR